MLVNPSRGIRSPRPQSADKGQVRTVTLVRLSLSACADTDSPTLEADPKRGNP